MSQRLSNTRSTLSLRAQARCALPSMSCSAPGHATHAPAAHIQRLRRTCCHVIVPLGRIRHLQVVAFRDAMGRPAGTTSVPARSMSVSEHVSIAVDYYRLLQVPRVSRPDAIRKSYENLVKQPPATAYSADTLFARAVLLKAAAESLTDPDLRRSYDAKLAAGHSALRVSQQDLPGALVVLQEIGEFQLVLNHGCRWLELNGSQPDAGDVAAAVALAYCDRASERLAAPSNRDAVLPACDDLDAALVQLRRYGMARQLQTQIVGALRDLAPEYACELVALPLGPDTAARRAKGVALMRGVLRSAATAVASDLNGTAEGAGAVLMSADADSQSVVSHARRMLQRGRDVLTCDEQVALLPEALRGSGATPHPDVLYDGALAYIVDGYRNGWPQSVHQADLLLQRLEEHVQRQAAAQLRTQDPIPSPGATVAVTRQAQQNGTAAAEAMPGVHQDEAFSEGAAAAGAEGPHGGTVALERAVCAILLGDYAAAMALLGLADGAVKGADAEVAPMATAEMQLRNFVMEHAPPGTKDMRPGLRALTTKWLAGVALHSFRDTLGQTVMPLETYWFANPRVAIYLQVWSMFRDNEKMLAATHFWCNLLPNMLRVFSAVGTKIVSVVTLAVLRVQRILAVMIAVAVAAVAPKPRRNIGSMAADRGSGPQGAPGKGISSNAPRVTAATVSVAEAATGVVGTSTAGPIRPSPAPTLSPFGHPYGKTLQTVASETSRAPLVRTGDVAAKRAAPIHAAIAPGPASTATAGAAVTMAAVADSNSNLDLRRRFAASAAVDAAESLAGLQGGLHSHNVGEDDQDDEAALPDDDLELDDPSSTRRRGMTEQELRAHLAGLELAMWDSELPSRGPFPQRIIFLALCAVTALAAMLFFVLRRCGSGGSSMPCCTSPVAPAVASVTVSAFVPPK